MKYNMIRIEIMVAKDSASKKTASTTSKKAPAAKKASSAKKSSEKSTQSGGAVKRHFTMLNLENGNKRGYYEATTPKSAASHAYSSYIKELRQNNKKIPSNFNFGLYETTRGSRNNVTCYTGACVKLKEPLVVERASANGEMKPITYKFRNIVTRNPDLDKKYGGALKKTKKTSEKKAGSKAGKKAGTKTAKKSGSKTGKKGSKKEEEGEEEHTPAKKSAKKSASKTGKKAGSKTAKKAAPAKKAGSKTAKKSGSAKKAPAKKK
jgi:hypothetical protein